MWGLLTIYWKNLHGFPPFELIGWRIFASFCALAPLVIWHKRLRIITAAMRSKEMGWRLFAASILVTVNWSSYVWAVAHDHVIETALGYFMAPLCTMWLGVAVLKEKLNTAQKVTISLAVAAIAILTVGYGRVPYLALLIAGSWSLYGLLKKQIPLKSIESLSGEMMFLFLPAIVLMITQGGSSDSAMHNASTWQWVLIAGTGIITVIPLWIFGYAAQHVPLTVLGPLQYSVPTINFLLGWLAYHEELDATRIIGFSLIWVALAVLATDTARRAQRSRALVIN
jgi:chloramphenicol-sensitive protein RarD